MHRDLKIGLSLGVLLLGVTGAFLFRKESVTQPGPRVLKSAKLLDERIAERPRSPYMTGDVEFDDDPFLSDKKDDAATAHTARRPNGFSPPSWLISDEEDPFANVPTRKSNAAVKTDHSFVDLGEITPLPIATGDQAIRPHAVASASTLPSRSAVTHVIEAGDTLSTIAQKYLGSSAKYHEIYEANQDVLPDPDHLPVGKTLVIPQPEERNTVTANRAPQAVAPAVPTRGPVVANRAQALDSLTGKEAGRDPFEASGGIAAGDDDELELPPISPTGNGTGSSGTPVNIAQRPETREAAPPVAVSPASPTKKFIAPSRVPFLRGTTATPAASKGGNYVVKRGDSLERISIQMYGSPRRARDLFEANRHLLSSPNAVREGQKLVIPE